MSIAELHLEGTIAATLAHRAHDEPRDVAFVFLEDGDLDAHACTNEELAGWAAGIAIALGERCAPGDRALLLFPSGLDDIAALFGCLLAGVVAVPVYPPRIGTRYEARDIERTRAVVADAAPTVVLSTAPIAALAADALSSAPELLALPWVVTDDPAIGRGVDLLDELPAPTPTQIAYLQYTSGSTGSPRGVVVRHQNLTANLEQIRVALKLDRDDSIASWLPLYHDMGLVGSLLLPVHMGYRSTLMAPDRFLVRPRRWPEVMSRTGATIGGGPNFGFDLAARKTPSEVVADLDLSRWTHGWNGAEPVLPDTLDRFAATFGPAGFDRRRFTPLYGLAEATVYTGGEDRSVAPVERSLSTAALAHGRAAPPADDADERTLVGIAIDLPGQEVRIVDPAHEAVVDDGVVGEVWIAGPHVGDGYWGEEVAASSTFGLALADEPTIAGGWLRTGDLGFLDDRYLFLCGRTKDLIIVGGRNRYPQDIEATVIAAHPACRPGGAAAFATTWGDEGVAVVVEVRPEVDAPHDEIVAAVRRDVAAAHELRLQDVVLVEPGGLPKTSSGKVQRRRAHDAWAAGELAASGA